MEKKLSKAGSLLFLLIGVACVLLPGPVTRVLPYLLGGAMVLAGVLRGVAYVRHRWEVGDQPVDSAWGLILLIMGAAFMIQGEASLGPIGTTWALIGIYKAAEPWGQVIRRIARKERFAAPLVGFLIRIVIAAELLFNPFDKISVHIVILGLELIAASIHFRKGFRPDLDPLE